MAERLSWKEIRKRYDQEWVELVDFDWPEEEESPRAGVVRVHSADHSEFYDLAEAKPPVDSAILFVGKRALPKDQIFSPGLRRVIADHA